MWVMHSVPVDLAADAGLIDLITVYDVQALVVAEAPRLAPSLTVDADSPRLRLATIRGDVVLLRTSMGWSISAPGLDAIYAEEPSVQAMAESVLTLNHLLTVQVAA